MTKDECTRAHSESEDRGIAECADIKASTGEQGLKYKIDLSLHGLPLLRCCPNNLLGVLGLDEVLFFPIQLTLYHKVTLNQVF